MTIHHSQIRKAEKAGYTLEERDDLVRAFWPKRALALTGPSASDAMTQMQAAMVLVSHGYRVVPIDEPRLVMVMQEGDDETCLEGRTMTPTEAHKILIVDKGGEFKAAEPAAEPNLDETIDEQEVQPNTKPIERSKNGVALDGAIAYAEGTPAGDCPFDGESEDEEEQERANEWYTAWDEAADAASEAEDSRGGTVVAEKYRLRYAEAGHPTHCGDWLAEFLNNQVLTKEGTDLARFEAICALNGVDTSKYKRDGIGWQGRLRMTGRNLLAKKVYLAGGILLVPGDDPAAGPDAYKAPGEWMQSQRFKMPKADQDKPIPDATIAVSSGKVLDSQGGDPTQPYDTPDVAAE